MSQQPDGRQVATEAQPARDPRRAVAFVVNMGAFLTPFMASSLNVALPPMGRDLSMGATALGWVASAFLLAAAIFTVPFGRIADIHGRRLVLLWGNVVFAISSLLSALAPNAFLMIAARALQGIGGAMLFGTGTALLTSVFPAHERGRVLGNNVTAVYLGLSVGPFVGGFLTQQLGWRSIFIVNFVLGLVLVATVMRKLRSEWAEARGESFDAKGAAIYGVSLVLMMTGFSQLSRASGLLFLVGGAVAFALFVAWELRSKSPILDLSLFRSNLVFAFSNLAALIHYSATFAVTFVLSIFLQSIQGKPPQQAGLILVAQPAMMALFSPLAGRLSDRVEPRYLASAGMTLTTAGVLALSFVGPGTATALIVGELLILGIGFALFSSPNTNAVMSSLSNRQLGVGAGILSTMRVLGQNLSMGMVMMVLALHLGARAIGPDTTPELVAAMRTLFRVFALLGVAGVLASLVRGRVHPTS